MGQAVKYVASLILLFSLSFANQMHGQDGDEGNGKIVKKKFYKKGKKLLYGMDYQKAIPFLKHAANMNPDEPLYSFDLGKAYFESGQFGEALPMIERAYNLDEFVDPQVEYFYARALHMNYKFKEAQQHYKTYLDNLDPEEEQFPIVEMLIKQCAAGPMVYAMNNNWKLTNLGPFVNSKYPDYAPVFNGDYGQMMYTTRRPRKIYRQMYGVYNPDLIREEIYKAQSRDSLYMKSELVSKKINIGSHDATGILAADGESMIYYRDDNYGDIFVSEKDSKGEWGKRVSIGDSINTEYNEPCVWICDDGETMYYSSDKPGGFGKKDLYVSKKLPDGSWGAGENMGERFNTILDDDSPYVGPEGKFLYFSSRGHNSMGGYDVFKCELQEDGTWGNPENMGYPTNTTGEDIYFFYKDKGPCFYISSNRVGGYGNMDIYEGCPAQPKEDNPTFVEGVIFDKKIDKNVYADVELSNKLTKEVYTTTKTDANGLYKVELPINGIEYALNFVIESKCTEKVPAETPPGMVNVITGTVIDGVSLEPINAMVELIDPVTGKVVDAVPTNPETGNYYVPVKSGKDYTVRVKSDKFLPYYEEFSVEKSGKIVGHNYEIDMQPTNQAQKLVIGWQFFDHDKYTIKAELQKDLDHLVDVMNKVPQLRIKLIGHTDWDGTDAYNEKLAERRANTVANYLIDNDVDPGRLEVFGMGEAQPIYDNSNPKLKKWNRRVEVFIIN